MQQLAMVNGFSLNKAEQRCGARAKQCRTSYRCLQTRTPVQGRGRFRN